MRSALLAALLLAIVAPAAAHGPPVGATELLATGERGVSFVRLTRGFAHLEPHGFRFLCPEAWGGNVLAPAAGLAGTVFVADETLLVIEPDGSVSPHPVQSGRGFAVASDRAAFGVFQNEGRWELRRLSRTTNELLKVLEQPIDALAVGQDEVALLRWVDRQVWVDRLSLSGELRASVTWTASSFVADANLRFAGPRLFAVLWGHSAPWVTLGRVAESYEPLREGGVDIAGPIVLPSGTLVSIDGALQTLEGTALGAERVTCLAELDGQPYACARSGLFRVDASGVGVPLFELRSLVEPDLQALTDVQRADCMTRWLDLRVDAVPIAAGVDASTVAAAVREPAGCSASSSNPSAALLVLLMLLARRRLTSA